MRYDRLAGFALIAIGALALFSRTTGASLSLGQDREPMLLDSLDERIEASSLRTLELRVEAGSLVVVGDRDSREVSLRAEFRGPDEAALRHLDLEHATKGDRLVVETRTGRSQGRINLVLRIPAGLDLLIDDGSGSIRVETVDGRVTIQDGSGSIRVSDVGGDLRVNDGSGSLSAERIAGSVHVDDGSGSIRVHDAGGAVDISDGSGSITVRGVAGDVRVRDGSGSIQVHDVEGRFHLAADGSGSVSTSRIRGGVDGRS